MRLVEIADWNVDWKSLRNPAADEADRALGSVLSHWVSGEHRKVQQRMLELEEVAARYRDVGGAKYLYRGLVTEGRGILEALKERGFYDMQTAPHTPLSSWSTSKSAVKQFMIGFTQYVIFRKPVSELKVYVSLPDFDKKMQPRTKMASQREVVVRMPPVMRISKKDVVEVFRERMHENFDYKAWAAEKAKRVHAAMADLRASAAAPYLKVFGSSITDKPQPTDIDVFVDLSDVPPGIKVAVEVMEVARRHFGLVDPFILDRKGKLYCHSPASHPEQMGWTVATKHVRAIIKAGKTGKPLTQFRHPLEADSVMEAKAAPKKTFAVVWGENKEFGLGKVYIEAASEKEARRIFKRDYIDTNRFGWGKIVIGYVYEPVKPINESASLPSLTYDQRNGIGAVPDNNNIEYLGLRVLMRPSQFQRLAAHRDFSQTSDLDGIMKAISEGQPIGSPFLEVNFGEGDGATIPRVRSHEGRTRMEAIRRLYGDIPVEVHIFPTGGLRARHIRPAAAERFRQIAHPEKQRDATVNGPHFDKLLSTLSLNEGTDATPETVTLLDLYDEHDLRNEREHLAHRVGPEDHAKPLPVRTMSPDDAKKLRVLMGDMSAYEAFTQFASRDQKRLVREKMRNFDHDRIIVIENDAVVDGNHHLIAAIKAKQPLRYVNLADLG